MKKQQLALLFNLLCFGALFVFFRYGIGSLLPLSYLPLVLGSAVLASFLAPKFLVHKENGEQIMVVKLPFVKSVKKL